MERPNKKDYILIDKTRDFMSNTYANDLERYCDELETINNELREAYKFLCNYVREMETRYLNE